MRGETEMVFAHIAHEDRSVLELIDSDYTFLNGKLAELYGIKDVTGSQMRKVSLPKDSPRGGVLAHASVLAGDLEPDPNVTGEARPVHPGKPAGHAGTTAAGGRSDRSKSRRRTSRIASRPAASCWRLHRAQPLCASCHARMDPLGLALENFNAMGLWRDKERGQPIDSTGKLISGESFRDVRELKRILKEGHKLDFYRCITEKLLTYALGRGLDYNDVETVDRDCGAAGSRGRAIFRAASGSDRIGTLSEAAERLRRGHRIERVSRTQSSGTVKAMRQDHSRTELGASPAATATRAAARSCAERVWRWPFPLSNRCCLALPELRPRKRRQARGNGDGRPVADGVRLRSQRRASGLLVAQEGRQGLRAQPRRSEPLEKVKEQIQILGGLDQINATAGPDGPGDHARASGSFLTGVRVKKTAGADIHAGISVDQVAAQRVGHLTRFPSLELTCDAVRKSGSCDSGYSCAYQFNLSWSGPTLPVAPEPNPRLVFERLFGAGAPASDARTWRCGASSSDRSWTSCSTTPAGSSGELGGRDQQKLDEYLAGVREIERRIQEAERFKETPNPAVETPAGIPASFPEHIQLMFDMMVLAFQTDSTRIATFLLANEGSNRTFPEIGISEGHHNLSHHFGKKDMMEKIGSIDLWYVQQFAKFLEKLESIKDVDGHSILHNSMIVYGSGNSDGNRHTHSNLPIILAGHGGGSLTTGRYAKYKAKPLNNLYLSMLDRFGIDGVPRLGDSTGRLDGV